MPLQCLSKGFERSVYWYESKTKSENKKMTNKVILSNQILLESIDFLF